MTNLSKKLQNKNKSYKKLFTDNKEGEEVLADLLEFCGQYKSSHTAGDPLTSAFNEGKRRVALRILKFIDMKEVDIQKIIKLTEENEEMIKNNDPFGLY